MKQNGGIPATVGGWLAAWLQKLGLGPMCVNKKILAVNMTQLYPAEEVELQLLMGKTGGRRWPGRPECQVFFRFNAVGCGQRGYFGFAYGHVHPKACDFLFGWLYRIRVPNKSLGSLRGLILSSDFAQTTKVPARSLPLWLPLHPFTAQRAKYRIKRCHRNCIRLIDMVVGVSDN